MRSATSSGATGGQTDEDPEFAPRWVINQPGVTTVIPGARTAPQVAGDAAAAQLPPLTADQLAGMREVYDRLVRPHVHHRWW